MKINLGQKVQWRIFFAEMMATGLLLLIGLSLVILMFGMGSPVPELIPNIGHRNNGCQDLSF